MEIIGEGRAEGEIEDTQYMKLKELLPEIAKKAYAMDVDSVSPIFPAKQISRATPSGRIRYRSICFRRFDTG